MNHPNNHEDELRRREQELKERELSLRLRELEADLTKKEPPLMTTTKHQASRGSLKSWTRKIVTLGKFLLVVAAVVMAVRVASWLAMIVIVGGIAWIAYKILFERDD